MAPITIEPIATTVAGEEPESAAKSMQAKTPAIAKPPRKWPTQAIELFEHVLCVTAQVVFDLPCDV